MSTALSILKIAAARSARAACYQPIKPSLIGLTTRQRFYSTENKTNENPNDTDANDAKANANAAEANTAAETEKTPVEPVETEESLMNKKIATLQDAYLQCVADKENLHNRTRKEIQQAADFGIQKFAKDLLDCVDILRLALNSIPEPYRKSPTAETNLEKSAKHLGDLYVGVSLTEAELVKTLKRYGVEQFGAIGEIFDPNLHQALYQAPLPNKKAGTILHVQKFGYTLKGRVLRPAQVGIVAEPPQ